MHQVFAMQCIVAFSVPQRMFCLLAGGRFPAQAFGGARRRPGSSIS